jgi:hypothetical protein
MLGYIENADETPPDWDFADFIPNAVKNVGIFDLKTHGRGQRKCNDAIQRAFQFTDVRMDAAGDFLQNIIGDVAPRPLGLGAQNGETGFQIGRLNVGGQPPLET